MINLLPPKRLLNLRVARTNTILRRYLELTVISVLVIAATLAGAYYFLHSQQESIRQTAEINQKKVEELQPIQKKAESLSVTVNTIAGLFSRNVKFSEMLTQIGGIMPAGSSLTGLQFSLDDLKSPLVVSAQVESEERAAVLRNNLAGSPLFKSAEIKSIVEIEATPAATSTVPADPATLTTPEPVSPYKYTTTINVYFKDAVGAAKP